MFQNKKKIYNSILIFLLLICSYISFIPVVKPLNNSSNTLGYEFLDDGKVLRIWNVHDSYYFNVSNGMQFTNHYQNYWTHNVMMLGYYNAGSWNLLYRTDELSSFEKTINLTEDYCNATLWKDLTYSGYSFRLAIRYCLGVNSTNLTVIPYIKNLGNPIPYTLGFGWELKDIKINMVNDSNFININETIYDLHQTLDNSYTNLTKQIHLFDEQNNTWNNYTIPNPTFIINNTGYYLYLRWNENLDYIVTVKSRSGQYNAPVTLFIKIGTLANNQEKYTNLSWFDSDLTLSPNAAGDLTECQKYPNTGEVNYQDVDDPPGSPDDFSTDVRNSVGGDESDLYNIPDHGSESGVISNVRIYARIHRSSGPTSGTYAYIIIKCGANIYSTSEISTPTEWTTYYVDYPTNPLTEGAWSWADIDDLQIGIKLTYTNRINRCTQVYAAVTYTPPSNWWDNDWSYRKLITIDHTKVEGNLINFPILFDNTSSSYINAQSDGDDFVFISYDNVTQYYHEIEKFNVSGNNRLIAWVNITSLSSTVDTKLWLYYGNPGCSSQQNPTGVWNSDFLTVQHMADNSTSTIKDSTNIYNGTKKGVNEPVVSTSGIVGDCQDFDGTDDKIDLSGAVIPANLYTIEVWYNNPDTTDYDVIIGQWASGQTGRLSVGLYTVSYDAESYIQVTGTFYGSSDQDDTDGDWHYGVFCESSDYMPLYVDKELKANETCSYDIYQGINTCIGNGNLGTGFFNDRIDEIRISKILRLWSWINTTYNTISSPSTFLTITSESWENTCPVSSNPIPADQSININVSIGYWNVTITDYDGNNTWGNITCNNSDTTSWSDQGNGTRSLALSTLVNSTTYTIWLNYTDGLCSKNETFIFTTEDGEEPFTDRITDMLEKVTVDLISNYIINITNYGPRPQGSANLNNTRNYIYSTLKNMSYWTRYLNWSMYGWTGGDVIAQRNGTNLSSSRVIVLSAHMDTVTGTVGADDDTSGCAAVLACAEIMKDELFNDTIVFALFDAEESGVVGSPSKLGAKAYVASGMENGTNFYVDLQMDMYAYYDGTNFTDIFTDSTTDPTKFFFNWVYNTNSKYSYYIGDLNVTDAGYWSASDHIAFWEQGYDAQFWHENTTWSYIHTPNDNWANLNTTDNMNYFQKNVKLTLAATANISGLSQGVMTAPVVTTYDATSVGIDYATLNGYLNFDGNQTCAVCFEYGSTTSYGNTTSISYKNSGESFSATLTSLLLDTTIHFRAKANNSYSTAYGTDKTFSTGLTSPNPPYSTYITTYNISYITLSWNKGSGANTTVIVKKNTGYPSSITDGTIIYNGTGTSVLEPYIVGETVYYRGWSYKGWINPNTYKFSTTGSDFTTITGGLNINCYDETTFQNLTFNVSISNTDGTDVFNYYNADNTLSINETLCPQGIVSILITSINHTDRIYYMTISPGVFYILNAYLPSDDPEMTALYYLKVVDELDSGIENAKLDIRFYSNLTGTYESVSVLYTDSYGYVNLYLMYSPTKNYKVFINKSGYYDSINDYKPAPPNEWGQTVEKVFRLTSIDTETTRNITILLEEVTIIKYNSTTFDIYYINLNLNSTYVNLTIYDGDDLLYSYNESSSPNDFHIYFDYTPYNLTNDILRLQVIATKNDNTTNSFTKYFNIHQIGRTGNLSSAPVLAIISVAICLFGLTLVAPKKTFGIVGIIVLIISIAFTAFADQTWYIHLIQAIEIILLMFVFLIFKEEGVNAV